MATPSEQKALAFVAMVALLGGVVRVVRAGGPATPSSLEQQALARQATAAESSASSRPPKHIRAKRGARQPRAAAEPVVVGGVASVPPSTATGAGLPHHGFPPAGPRIDVDYRANRAVPASEVSRSPQGAGEALALVDLDRASAGEIERLPWIGPALARRIVANRDSFGAFGSLGALDRVQGIGPATRKRLSSRVTFSVDPSSRP